MNQYTLENLTPESMCIIGGCPAVYENKVEGTYLIVGKKIEPATDELRERVGKGEVLIEIPKGLLKKIIAAEH